MTPEPPPPRDRLIGVGCDTEERSRLEGVLARDPAFLGRWFTAKEQEAIARAADGPGLALRLFCLKEAAVKALWRHIPLGISRIEALPAPEGYRLCALDPRTATLRLDGHCQADARHAWAEVLAFHSPAAASAGGETQA
ncbi:MAG: 4'-phosphopantetheinyl transferase superfamily protein [bacterium]|nr:4'-phosphopantetheinyl transferase superfamily protein [bacterium]